MAEVRKFKPGSSPIADAIARAMGEPVRPVAPGSAPTPRTTASASQRVDIFTSTTSGFTVPRPAPKDAGDQANGADEA